MKQLSELGISPTPWYACEDGEVICGKGYSLTDGDGYFVNPHTACLIAAAPKMYGALYKITKEQECGQNCEICRNSGCVVKECKAILAEASGESEVRQ